MCPLFLWFSNLSFHPFGLNSHGVVIIMVLGLALGANAHLVGPAINLKEMREHTVPYLVLSNDQGKCGKARSERL